MTYQSTHFRDVPRTSHLSTVGFKSPQSVLKRLLSRVKKQWAQRAKQREDRLAFRQLLSLDDSLLDDIGVSRGDVEWASQLPLWQNASQELEQIARDSRRSSTKRARPKQRH